ncbi:hypothetical protein ABR737_33805 [Streptomyces sp. Edi2]|uniref:hypothetical protein n=1 Tax=Streptomyces sp. Edi2 TaxID=3162528 RepID=UPI0033068EF2
MVSTADPRRGYTHLLLIHCSIADPSKVAYFAVHARTGTKISEIARVMGLRWATVLTITATHTAEHQEPEPATTSASAEQPSGPEKGTPSDAL